MTNHYRRRPAEIQAIQWTSANETELRTFAGPDFDTIDIEDRIDDSEQDAQVLVEDSHWVGIKPTDWVLKFDGYFVTKSDETFRAVWEPTVEPDQAAVRASIAAALRVHYHCPGDLDPDGPIPCACGWMDPGPDATHETDFDAHMADVVLGVLPPPTDQAAVARVHAVLETEAVVGRSALEYRGLIRSALMAAEAPAPETQATLPFIHTDDDGDQLTIRALMASTYEGETPVVSVDAAQHDGEDRATVYVRPERVEQVVTALRAARQAAEALPATAAVPAGEQTDEVQP